MQVTITNGQVQHLCSEEQQEQNCSSFDEKIVYDFNGDKKADFITDNVSYAVINPSIASLDKIAKLISNKISRSPFDGEMSSANLDVSKATIYRTQFLTKLVKALAEDKVTFERRSDKPKGGFGLAVDTYYQVLTFTDSNNSYDIFLNGKRHFSLYTSNSQGEPIPNISFLSIRSRNTVVNYDTIEDLKTLNQAFKKAEVNLQKIEKKLNE